MEWETKLDEWLALRRSAVASKFLGRISDKGRILDIGCGAHLPLLRRAAFDQRVGTDLQLWPEWQSRDDGMDVVVHRVDERGALPFADQVFDAVTMLAVLEHISPKSAESLLAESHRVLRPGGGVVITTPPRRTDRLLPVLGRLGLISKESPAEHVATYSKSDLADRLSASGFRNVDVGTFEFGMNLWAAGIK